jgi:hypothetical protein
MVENMNNKCCICGKKQGLLDYNYAGFTIDKNKEYSFPFRISVPKIYGNKSNEYLCCDCINVKYKVTCSVHGVLRNKYEYANPPRCYKCVKEFSNLKNGVLPNSFKSIVSVSKLVLKNKYTDCNTFFAVSKSDYFLLYNNLFSCHGKLSECEFNLRKNILIGIPKPKVRNVFFEIDYNDEKCFIKGKGNWINPWLKNILFRLKVPIENKLSLSDFTFYEVEKNRLFPSPKIVNSIFWTVLDENIVTHNNSISLPSLNKVQAWSLINYSYPAELKILFKENYKLSILKITENRICNPLTTIEDLIQLPNSKKVESDTISFKNGTGIYEFISEKKVKTYCCVENKEIFITATNLKNGKTSKYTSGYTFNDYYLFINETMGSFIISANKQSTLKPLLDSIKIPIFDPSKKSEYRVYCFNNNQPGKIIIVDLHDKEFIVNNDITINYKEINSANIKKTFDSSTISVNYPSKKENKKIELSGPSKYIEGLFSYIENKRAQSGLNTLELYQTYNKNKKNNLLIGLLSDLLLLDKEIEKNRGVDDLLNQITAMNSNSFMENNSVFKSTVNKLLIFIKSLPDIKQNLELLNSFFPHYHAKDEMDFISEAFGDDVATKINSYEYDIIKDTSRKSILLIQSKIQKVIAEIERSVSPIESFFTKDEIEKEYISKVSKYSSLGGQAILVGTLVATGGATGGIGILGGMLGIRAMSDYFNIISRNKEKGFLIKKSAEKAFSWWITFKKTLPVTIYELDRILNQENNRCISRDKAIFTKLNKTNGFSIAKLNKALENRIIKSNKIRFNEIINGTGIIFNDVAVEIENRKKFEIESLCC